MKQPHPPVNSSSINRSLFFYGLASLVFVAALLALFLFLNQRVQTASGIVASTYSKRAMTSRKQSGEKRFAFIKYSVGGEDFHKGFPIPPRMQSSQRQHVAVHYYPGLPQFSWAYRKTNNAVLVLTLIVGAIGVIVFFTGLDLRKNSRLPTPHPAKLGGKRKEPPVHR